MGRNGSGGHACTRGGGGRRVDDRRDGQAACPQQRIPTESEYAPPFFIWRAAHLRETDESLMYCSHDLGLAALKWMVEGK
jgi:hypothetical protein